MAGDEEEKRNATEYVRRKEIGRDAGLLSIRSANLKYYVSVKYIYEENVNSVSVLCPYALYYYADIIVAFVDFYVNCIS